MRAELKAVESPELPEYPISADERLDSHFFLMWNLKRWRGSEFRKTVDPESGWYGFQLFCIAQDGCPIGTLPDDDVQLAFDLNLTVEQWKVLRGRAVSPLQNWYPVQCDNGEVRLAHPVVTEVAVEAIDGKKRNSQKLSDDRMRKRFDTIKDNLKNNIPGAVGIASSEDRVNNINNWITERYPGGSVTTKRVREALDGLFS
ncbi:MAG: hypothetical protein ABJO67_03285 [Pseudoruegeria sp.]